MNPLHRFVLAHLTVGGSPLACVEAAAAAGFAGVGLRIGPRRPGEPLPGQLVGDAPATTHVREVAADRGVRIASACADQFFPDTRWDDLARTIDTAAALGCPVITTNGFDPDVARFTDVFARFCERAAEIGVRVGLEFVPYSSISTLAAAMDVVHRAGVQNTGVVIDNLHLDRSGGDPGSVRCLPPDHIVLAQLCDARKVTSRLPTDALRTEARTARLPLGAGELPVRELIATLPSTIDLEYEVARVELAGSPFDKARLAMANVRSFLRADAPPRPFAHERSADHD